MCSNLAVGEHVHLRRDLRSLGHNMPTCKDPLDANIRRAVTHIFKMASKLQNSPKLSIHRDQLLLFLMVT